MDSTLNSNLEWVEKVCDEIKDIGILWCDSATPSRFNKNLLNKLRKAGCIRMTWGVESLSDEILKKMRKGFDSKTA